MMSYSYYICNSSLSRERKILGAGPMLYENSRFICIILDEEKCLIIEGIICFVIEHKSELLILKLLLKLRGKSTME